MAVIMESFSIREYASRMRSVDVVKCWPFDEASEEEMKAKLPPITIKKFRWWIDELESIRLKEDGEEESDPEVSESLASMRMRSLQELKAKGKAPKKRSIVELFAVAPPVERVNSSDEEDEDSFGDTNRESGFGKLKSLGIRNVGLNCKSKMKVRKKRMGMLKKVVKDFKKKDSKKVKKGIMMKEKPSKLKLVPSLNSTAHPDCSTLSKGMVDDVSIHLKKPKAKSLATEAKSKAKRTSKLLRENKKLDFPWHGMLKSRTKTCRPESKISLHKIQNLNKHFALSLKDNVLEPRRKESPRMELELFKHSNLSYGANVSNFLDSDPAALQKGLSFQAVKETEETSSWIGHYINVQPTTQKPFSIRYHVNDAQNSLTQHASSCDDLFGRSIPSDQYAFNRENPLRFEDDRREQHASLYPYPSRTLSMNHKENVPNLTVPVIKYPAEASCSSRASLLQVSGDLDARFASLNGEDYNEFALQRPWVPRMSPKELMHTVCCIPDQRSKVKVYGERSINEDPFGLPLNSQGELIRLSSNENGGLYQLGGSSVLPGSNINSIVCSDIPSESLVNKPYNGSWNVTSLMKKLELCTIKDSGKETDYIMPSRLSLIEHCHYRQTNAPSAAIHPSFPFAPNLDQMKMSCISSRQDDRYGTYHRSEIIQQHCSPNQISMQLTRSTMRLMGQEFVIDGGELHGPDDREFLRDKQMITEQQSGAAGNGSSLKSQFLPESTGHSILGRLKCGGMHLSEYDNNRASGNLSHVMPPESTIFPLLDDQSIVTCQTDYGLSEGSSSMPEIYPHFPVSVDFLSDCHNDSHLPVNLTRYTPLKVSQPLLPASVFHDTGKNARSCLQLENKEMPVPAGKLPFEFPFPCSEFRRHIQPSCCERSFEVIPPRLFETRQKGLFVGYNQALGARDSVCCPWPVPCSNHDRDPSVRLTPDPSKRSPRSAFHNNVASASIHPTLVPVHPCSLQDTALLNRFGENMKNKEPVNTRIGGMMLNHGNGTKRRLASASNQCTKPMKMLKLGSREDSQHTAPRANTNPNLKWDVRYHGQGPDSASDKCKANTLECIDNMVNTHEPRDSGGKDSSYEVQRPPRSGPVKLTAGARHILKPCQRKESMKEPSLSTIPFAATPPGGVFTCEKSSKSYQL